MPVVPSFNITNNHHSGGPLNKDNAQAPNMQRLSKYLFAGRTGLAN
ncbi:MAG: hypothetical protein HC821_04560 [Lewinella sp.]|nr:hypothetical protein [Lewinella sp.]